MRAVVLPEFGSPVEVREVDVPEPEAGEVRVRVSAASVNGFDLAVANGYLNGMMEHRFPVVLGKDFAGTVDAVGAGVEGFAVGDRVFGVVSKSFLGDGSFGEYVTVPVAVGIAQLPEGIDSTTAAALGLAGTAAVDSFDAADLKKGQWVLIAGATGGVGNQVVQLAAKAGAKVIATAHSEQERAQVTELGAAEIVDYAEDVAAQVRAAHPEGVDVVVHLAGDPAALLSAVSEGGRFVSTLVGSPEQLPAEGVTVLPIMASSTPDTLVRLAENNSTGHTTVTIQQIFELGSATDAFAAFGAGTRGKIVISLD
ncbi:MAG: NADP-dependent oxidoreductase [Microbacterium sp.]|uniref:NADP-dependent oxidoreductase n=1 Tax=Microbacterium sp. TaxID=51671 RepID=UPI002718BB97|nr:NADP-dependent oxidoreductase [Microbacterium sp.]MDO8382021.1 NADP-dependent oxidoreductase [Microbacterium sp.]